MGICTVDILDPVPDLQGLASYSISFLSPYYLPVAPGTLSASVKPKSTKGCTLLVS